jgi:hypothetical protein
MGEDRSPGGLKREVITQTLKPSSGAAIYGPTLQAAEKIMLCVRARLYSLRKNSLNEGHGFSRAIKSHSNEGFSP